MAKPLWLCRKKIHISLRDCTLAVRQIQVQPQQRRWREQGGNRHTSWRVVECEEVWVLLNYHAWVLKGRVKSGIENALSKGDIHIIMLRNTSMWMIMTASKRVSLPRAAWITPLTSRLPPLINWAAVRFERGSTLGSNGGCCDFWRIRWDIK